MSDLLPANDFTRTLVVDGRERWYAVHTPLGWNGVTPLPCVLAIHGATSNPRLMERFSGLNAKADAAGFAVVYPAGTGNLPNVLTWNGGGCCGYALQHQVDDIAFLDVLLKDLAGALLIDPKRLFLVGMSNGAHMAYRYAAARSERVAALACVAGPMAMTLDTIQRPVPLLHIHGTDDEFAPFAGGQGPKSLYGAALPSIPETIAAWVRVNRCLTPPTVENLPDEAGDGTTIVRTTYAPGPGGAEVILIVVENGGHTWPGRPPLPLLLGKSTSNLNGNDVLWDFFQRHPLGGSGS